MKKVLVIDTSVLCVWLKVPGKEKSTIFLERTRLSSPSQVRGQQDLELKSYKLLD